MLKIKDNIDLKELASLDLKIKELQERINKAIEFIADYKDQWIRNDEVVDDMNELLSILKGEDNED